MHSSGQSVSLLIQWPCNYMTQNFTNMLRASTKMATETFFKLYLCQFYLFCGYSAALDVNECLEGTDDCSDHALCSNTVGSFTCTCNDGYEGDGKTCRGT